ncbi:MAG: hypothetical protein KKA28_17825 [Planctomycetes bacterium]|nr:hypothetical protein [Planctomycetota bacterium]MCG2685390.1 hypothetical protein [Planctomycetales bacterium]
MLSDTLFPFEPNLLDVFCDVDPGSGKPPHQIAPLTFNETSDADQRMVTRVDFFATSDADQREIIQDGPHPIILYRVAKDTQTRDTSLSSLAKKQVCWVVVEGSQITNDWDAQLISEDKAVEIRKLKGGTAPADGEPTGDCPVPPDGFRFRGKVYRGLAPRPFAAFVCSWNAPERSASRTALAEAVWDDPNDEQSADEEGLAGLRRDLNTFFRAHKIGYHARVKNWYLSILDGNPKVPAKKQQPRRR